MENSIKTMSGGTAAEIENINPNPRPRIENQMNTPRHEDINQDATPAPLKPISERFQCNGDTLKKNIKNNRLQASQKDPKAPYLVKPSDVEKFLRETPGIASIFHPKTVTTVTTGESHTQTTDDSLPNSKAMEDGEVVPAAEEVRSGPDAATDSAKGGEPDRTTEPKTAGTPQSPHPRKPRRRRRRGKGGTGLPKTSLASPIILKALNGSSPEERLRITACLNELAGLVASA